MSGTATGRGSSWRAVARVAAFVLLVAGAWFARVDLFSAFTFTCYAGVGALLVYRRPGQVIGWVLIAIAYGFLGTTSQPGVDIGALVRGEASLAAFIAVWASTWSGYATFAGYIALMTVFPSGRIGDGPGRRRAIVLIGGAVLITVLAATAPYVAYTPQGSSVSVLLPNRLAILPWLPVWAMLPLDLLIVPMAVLLVIGAAAMLRRYRRAVGQERLQLRWLVAALVAVVSAVIVGLTSFFLVGDLGIVNWLPAIVAYPLVPAAIYVAITRYRLYDIDRLISRTIGWAVVTAVLAAVFVGGVVVLQAVLAPVTRENTIAVAASTLVAFALFQPLRRRVQRAVDLRFDRARIDAERTLREFATRLRGEVELTAVEAEVVRTVAGALRPTGIGVWLRGAR